MTRKQNVLFLTGILLIIGLAVVLHGFLILQEVDEGAKRARRRIALVY